RLLAWVPGPVVLHLSGLEVEGLGADGDCLARRARARIDRGGLRPIRGGFDQRWSRMASRHLIGCESPRRRPAARRPCRGPLAVAVHGLPAFHVSLARYCSKGNLLPLAEDRRDGGGIHA